MSNAKRPGVQRKVTRASKEKQDAALNEGISITYEGKTYTVRMGDLSGLDTMALRREAGYSFIGLMRALKADPDIDLIAAIVWLARRIDGEIALAFEDVVSEFDYSSDFEIAEKAEEPEPGEDLGGIS